jgi:hypothetical protein
MTQIDQYITRATAGLLSRERIDTAAELRVHLNAQAKKHMLEGHTIEEAEFLAVDAMGAVATVNRQFLGHIFTPRVGWGVLIASVIGLAGWFGGKYFFDNQTYAREIPVNIKDVLPSLGRYWSFEYRLPQGAKSYYLALNTPKYGQNIFSLSNLDFARDYFTDDLNLSRSVDRRTIKIILWRPKQENEICNPKSNLLHRYVIRNGISHEDAVLIPCQILGKNILFSSKRVFSIQPELNRWQPLFELEPRERLKKNYTPFRDFGQNQSVVLQVYASSELITDKSNPESDSVNRPPPFWDLDPNDYRNFTEAPKYNNTNGQTNLKINIPKNSNSFEVMAAANNKLFYGKTTDLTTQPELKNINLNLSAGLFFTKKSSPATDNCYFVLRVVQVWFTPGESTPFSPCTTSQTVDTPKNMYFGAHIQPQQVPNNIPLETWIPVYALPAHLKPKEFGTPSVNRDVNQWYVVMVKFSSKRQQDSNLPKPSKPFKFRLKDEYVYSSLEVVK